MRGHDEDSANALRVPIGVLRAVNESKLPLRGSVVLLHLFERPDGKDEFQAIKRACGMSSQAQLSRACDTLEKSGLVARSASTVDLRVTTVSITPEGRNAVRRFKKAWLGHKDPSHK